VFTARNPAAPGAPLLWAALLGGVKAGRIAADESRRERPRGGKLPSLYAACEL
jgi:hypothetical protein